ncbi:MtnX-like HAD-IB family phosphatase [bacterium]|nr:MtnX-like HAD-IB family phosphatase [bacterium]
MKNQCIICDFDGTITEKDGLYSFIELYAQDGWEDIEQLWIDGKISSKECLTEEFKLVKNLSESLVNNFVETLNIDKYFKDFYSEITAQNIDLYIVSDGIDYFINRILKRYNLEKINVISNHGEFKNGNFILTFPNDYSSCKNNAGTCKCKVLSDLRQQYNKIIYIGDGASDYCVCNKADVLYAKSSLKEFCKKNQIQFLPFCSFKDILMSFK